VVRFLPAPGHPCHKNSDRIPLGLINLEIRYQVASTLKRLNLTSGKPKPFSSVDERDVEPCF